MRQRLSIVRIPPKRAVHPKVETFSGAWVFHTRARIKITILTSTTKKKEDTDKHPLINPNNTLLSILNTRLYTLLIWFSNLELTFLQLH